MALRHEMAYRAGTGANFRKVRSNLNAMTCLPRPRPRGRTPWLALACLLMFCQAVRAAPAPEIRVLVDVSGSMKKTDPQNLRIPALKLLAELLPAGSKAGVWLFAEGVTPLLPVSKVDAGWKQRARQGASRIHSQGQFTDIEQALRAASKDWTTAAPPGVRHLVLLTDGKVDVAGNAAGSEASRQRVLGELLQRLADQQVRVHTIALSEDADRPLLQGLSAKTDGWSEITQAAEALQRAFLHIFEQAATPDALPLKDNRFTVDAGVKELTLLVFHGPGNPPITLTDPSGDALGAAKPREHVRWQSEAGYDLVTITAPAPGDWQFSGSKDPDNRALIVTDLSLAVADLPTTLLAGQRLALAATLEERGRAIEREDFLKLVEMDAGFAGEAGVGELVSLARSTEPGKFDGHGGQGLGPGAYELTFRAHSATFQREKRLRLQVLDAPLSLAVAAGAAGTATARVKLAADLLAPHTLGGYLQVTGPGNFRDAQPLAPTEGDTSVLEFKLPRGGEYTFAVDAIVESREGQALHLRPAAVRLQVDGPAVAPAQQITAARPPPVPKVAISSLETLALVAAGNGLLLLVLGPLWWFLRKPGLPTKGVSL